MDGKPASEVPVVRVKDKDFSLSIGRKKIASAVRETARSLSHDYEGMNPLFLVVLNGAFMFAADLIREIKIPCELTFTKLSSYSGTDSSGKVRILLGLNEELQGRHVVIVEDIVDTGLSMEFLLEELQAFHPASVRIATFLFKPDAFIKEYQIDYVGIEIPNEFIVGYGLDYDGYGRNLSDIYTLVP